MANRRPLKTVAAVFGGGPEPFIVSASSAIGGALGEVCSQSAERIWRRHDEQRKATEVSKKIDNFLTILAQAQENHGLEAAKLQRLAVRLGERRTEWQSGFSTTNEMEAEITSIFDDYLIALGEEPVNRKRRRKL